MACDCRGGRRVGASTSSGATVQGYEYTAPDGVTVKPFLIYLEAKKEQRRNGGGTIKTIVSGA